MEIIHEDMSLEWEYELSSKGHDKGMVEERKPYKRMGSGEFCPECGAEMVPEGGCFSCWLCGYSPCE